MLREDICDLIYDDGYKIRTLDPDLNTSDKYITPEDKPIIGNKL